MSTNDNAEEFYERLLEGTEHSKTITLEHTTGDTLNNVELTVVDKKNIADAVEDMPDELFEATEDEDVDADEAEEIARQTGQSAAISEEVVTGFEDLCGYSLEHPSLSDSQMRQIIEELDFTTLFELGTEILNFSVENSGDVKGFREQS